MENTIKLKERLAGGVRRYGRVLSLIVALVALSNSAWAALYLWAVNSNGSELNEYSKIGQMQETSNVFTSTLTNWNSSSNYCFFISTSDTNDPSTAHGVRMNAGTLVSGDFYLKREKMHGVEDVCNIYNPKKTPVIIRYVGATNTLYAESGAAPVTTRVPSIRIGKKAVVSGTNVTFNGQIADWGCANVTGIKVKYSKNGGATQTKSIKTGLSINSNANTGDIETSAWDSGEYTYTLIATNSEGDSQESDQGVFEIACTTPTKAQYTMATGQSFTYDTQSHQPTVSVATGAGAISSYSYSTDNSNWVSSAVNVGTYYVKVNVSAGTQYCAANDIVLDNTFAITKADQAAFSISNKTTTFCKSAAPTVTTTGGSGSGAVTFSKDFGTNGITVNESTGKITANNAGIITVKATKAGDTNYNVATATKTFTINAEPAQPGTISGNASPCVNATGLTYSITEVATATGYTWTVPAGWSITAGAGTRSITATAGTAGGNITVKANNDCGSSAVQTLAVTVKGKAITVSPTTVSAKKYTPTAITATTDGDVTWAVTGTNNYLLNADNTVYTSGNVKQVTVKAVSNGTVTATTTNDGCETSATVTLTPSADTETCN